MGLRARTLLRRATNVGMGLVLALCASAAQSHGGLAMEEDFCKLRVGRYLIHFTGYQPDSTTTKEFCEDIPATGRTIVVLDYINDELRDLPTEVRIVKDTGSAPSTDPKEVDANTVLHVPAKVYPAGTLHFEHNFREPGKFVGLVTVVDKQPMVSRFPFSVGKSGTDASLLLPGIAAVVGGVGLYLFARRKREQANARARA